MIPLQLLSLLFGLFMLYWSFYIYKKHVIAIIELFFWTFIWLSFIVIALFPESTKFILQTFRINRTLDLVTIIAFMVLWIVSYKNYLNNKLLKRKLEQLVKDLAIKEAGTTRERR